MAIRFSPAEALRNRIWREVMQSSLAGTLARDIEDISADTARFLQENGLLARDAERSAVGHVRCALGLNPEPRGDESLAEAAQRALGNKAPESPTIVAIPGACSGCRDMECAAEEVCITGAVRKGPDGTVQVDNERCLNCGLCIGACRAAALSDKAEIVQVSRLILDDKGPVTAVVAPAFAGQFGPDVFGQEVTSALNAFGFDDVVEVALGADVITIKEAKQYIERIMRGNPFMITSCCCPPFIKLVQKFRPHLAHLISDSVSPMIAIGRLVKAEHPGTRVVFIGPCIAKKSEARQPDLADAVDFVLTFQETKALLEAGGIEVPRRADAPPLADASHDGRIYGHTGGVSAAIIRTINKLAPGLKVEARQGNGIKECNELLRQAQAGKLGATFLEGMACPGGCVGGPGKLVPPEIGHEEVDEYAAEAPVLEAVSNDKARQLFTRHAPMVDLTSEKPPQQLQEDRP